MKRRIILATHNDHKSAEIKEIFKDFAVEVVSLKDLNDFDEIIETEDTFVGNAKLKALAIAKKYQAITLADDSGLEIKALNGAPGVYSARYSNKGTEGNIKRVLEELGNIEDRRANFTCVMVLAFPNLDTFVFEGKVYGTITKEKIGTNGFGYDPIFLVDGYNQTMAQLPSVTKNKISHRALALDKLKAALDSILK